MSRSYKKYPHWTCRSRDSKWFRRNHAKKVRKNWDIPNGGAYKRLVCIWDLEDYKFTEFRKFESIEDETVVNWRTGELTVEPVYTKRYWRQGKSK